MEFVHVSAVTLAVREMYRSVDFYQRIGLELSSGGPRAAFTTFRIGKEEFLNLMTAPASVNWWGRIIVRVRGVDALYRALKQKGLHPEAPRDGEWGEERYFHILARTMHRFSSRSAASAGLTRRATEAPGSVLSGTLRRPTERNTVRTDDGGDAVENSCIIRA